MFKQHVIERDEDKKKAQEREIEGKGGILWFICEVYGVVYLSVSPLTSAS